MNKQKDFFHSLGEQISRFFRRPGRQSVPGLLQWQRDLQEKVEYDFSAEGVWQYFRDELLAYKKEPSTSRRPFKVRFGIPGDKHIEMLIARLGGRNPKIIVDSNGGLREIVTWIKDKQGNPVILQHAHGRFAVLTTDALLPETQNAIDGLKKTRSQRR